MKRLLAMTVCLILAAATTYGALPAVTAEQAFDAVQLQMDPITGVEASVLLLDVRSRAEWYWVGTASQVTEITTANGKTFQPDLGKVVLVHDGKFLDFEVDGRPHRVPVVNVDSITIEPIATSLPYRLWDEGTAALVGNPDFVTDLEALIADYDVVIIYCRSGGRTDTCIPQEVLDAYPEIGFYEIDRSDATNLGGFEGSSYGNSYNGYRGFPQRETRFEDLPSVSWKDAGLPIKIGVSPF